MYTISFFFSSKMHFLGLSLRPSFFLFLKAQKEMAYNIILNIELDKLKMCLIYEGTWLSLRLLALTHMNCSMSKLRKLCCTTIYVCISISMNKRLCVKIFSIGSRQTKRKSFHFYKIFMHCVKYYEHISWQNMSDLRYSHANGTVTLCKHLLMAKK